MALCGELEDNRTPPSAFCLQAAPTPAMAGIMPPGGLVAYRNSTTPGNLASNSKVAGENAPLSMWWVGGSPTELVTQRMVFPGWRQDHLHRSAAAKPSLSRGVSHFRPSSCSVPYPARCARKPPAPMSVGLDLRSGTRPAFSRGIPSPTADGSPRDLKMSPAQTRSLGTGLPADSLLATS